MLDRMPVDMTAAIESVAAYTAQHPELASAHHFLFDLRYPAACAPKFVVMGINPGEVENDWRLSPTPTEETSRHDFHRRGEVGGHVPPWVRQASFYLDGAPYVQAELFFWSSRDLAHFKERFGSLAASPHLKFCAELNRQLISAYRPAAVVCPGIGTGPLCERLYGLKPIYSFRADDARVVEVCFDGERPWLFTKHWTGSFGLTNVQREAIRRVIRALAADSDQAPDWQDPEVWLRYLGRLSEAK